MVYCQNCGEEIPEDSSYCPNCGSKVEIGSEVKREKVSSRPEETKESSRSWPKIVGGVVVVIVAIFIVGGLLGSGGLGSQTLVDETCHIEGGTQVSYTLDEGKYSVEIDSDDDLDIDLLGGGIGNWVDSEGVRDYSEDFELTESGTLNIANPSGILSTPTATVQIKIVKK